HLRRGSLLLQRFSEFVQETRVLDGDDGLRREIRQEFYLLFGKRKNLLAVERDGTNQLVFLQHRDNSTCGHPQGQQDQPRRDRPQDKVDRFEYPQCVQTVWFLSH